MRAQNNFIFGESLEMMTGQIYYCSVMYPFWLVKVTIIFINNS